MTETSTTYLEQREEFVQLHVLQTRKWLYAPPEVALELEGSRDPVILMATMAQLAEEIAPEEYKSKLILQFKNLAHDAVRIPLINIIYNWWQPMGHEIATMLEPLDAPWKKNMVSMWMEASVGKEIP